MIKTPNKDSVVDPNTLKLDPDLGFCPNLDPFRASKMFLASQTGWNCNTNARLKVTNKKKG